MQDILHTAIIALPVGFATLMFLDLISTLKQLWDSCKPSTSVSIPASILQLQPEIAEPVAETEESEIMPDPWKLEASAQPIVTTPKLTLIRNNVLLLPPAKTVIEVIEVAETVTLATKRKAGRPPKKTTILDAEFSPNPVAKRKAGRPRKVS
ncbi:MAG: hypothetical protein KME57_36355 [Scytonema hyalinum WJT4-NPBG1]|jgi:hypothetical protein|nr:hypothetical protein [Scytonema hyalinum WJT4-NPBG1]